MLLHENNDKSRMNVKIIKHLKVQQSGSCRCKKQSKLIYEAMPTVPYLKRFIEISLFFLMLEDTLVNSNTAAVEIDQDAIDGHQYVKKIVHGDSEYFTNCTEK